MFLSFRERDSRSAKTLFRAAICVAIMFLSLLITGCENYYHYGPYELGYDGQHLLVASCEARNVTTVYVEERGGRRGDRLLIWEASGEARLGARDEMVVGGDNRGLANETVQDADPQPGVRYFISMNREPDRITSALFEIPSDGINEGSWVDPRGSVSTQPCAAKP